MGLQTDTFHMRVQLLKISQQPVDHTFDKKSFKPFKKKALVLKMFEASCTIHNLAMTTRFSSN
jgi:hypothetical protein